MRIKLVSTIVLLFLFAVFTVQNAQIVTVSFLFWKIEASRVIVLMVTFLLGLFSGWVIPQLFRRRNR